MKLASLSLFLLSSFAAVAQAQNIIETLSGFSLYVYPTSNKTDLRPVKLVSETTDRYTMLTCNDQFCGATRPESWYLKDKVLIPGLIQLAIYTMTDQPVPKNTSPSFIRVKVGNPVPKYPIYTIDSPSKVVTKGLLAVNGYTTKWSLCNNLIPTFAPTDRFDIFFDANPKAAVYPRGACVPAGILVTVP
ncbi:hypothetical protein FRC17_009675 [Serendipita sp. 399]|nr:hypothetical protein FRC17_009675 [Serendipita sp. 399]